MWAHLKISVVISFLDYGPYNTFRYALAIFILNLLIGFLSPIEDPEGEVDIA